MEADGRIGNFLAAGRYAQELTPVDALRRELGDYHVALGYLVLDGEVIEARAGVLTPVDPSSVARHEVVLIGGKMSLGGAGQTHTVRE
jgi:hypothetical protein